MECETKPTPQCLLSGCQPRYAPIKLTTCLVLYLFSSSIRKVPQSEQNVLDKTRGPVAQMAAKSLHTTSLEGEVGGSQNKLSLLHIVKDPWNKPHGLPNVGKKDLPPTCTISGLLLGQTDSTFRTRLQVQSSFS